MAAFPNKMHMLHSLHGEGQMGLFHTHSYVLSFISSEQVMHVCKNTTKESKILFRNYKPSTYTIDSTESPDKARVEIVLGDMVDVEISKDFQPNWDWFVETVDRDLAFTLPLNHNIGLVIPYKTKEETDKYVVYESFIVDPLQDTRLFRTGLLQYPEI